MADILIDRIAQVLRHDARARRDRRSTSRDGEFVALLGPSGCGKTTLLRIIAGLETQTAGRIVIGGRDVTDLPPRARGLAMVFQNYAVFPHMTVYENIAFGLRMQRADDARVKRQVDARRRAAAHRSRARPLSGASCRAASASASRSRARSRSSRRCC